MGLGKFWNVQTEFDRENPMNNTESEGRIIQLSGQYTLHIHSHLQSQLLFISNILPKQLLFLEKDSVTSTQLPITNLTNPTPLTYPAKPRVSALAC